MQTTAIILAGGKSKRMGTDKALLELNGISLLEKSLTLCEIVCDKILISSNKKEHSNFAYPLVADEIKNCGPIGGIYSCLKQSDTEWNFVISVDSPMVNVEFVQYLIAEMKDFDAIVPIHSGGKEPLVALYHKRALPEIEKRIRAGNYKMYDLLQTLNTRFIDSQLWLDKFPQLFANINRAEDFDLLKAHSYFK